MAVSIRPRAARRSASVRSSSVPTSASPVSSCDRRRAASALRACAESSSARRSTWSRCRRLTLRLKAVAPVLEVAHALARRLQALLQRLDLVREPVHLNTDFAKVLLALDHAGMRIGIARQPQPVGSQPYAVARHHGCTGRQPAAQAQGLAQCLGGVHRGKQRAQYGCALNLGLQRTGVARRGRRLIHADHRQVPAVEARQQVRDAVQPIDAHGLQVGSEHGFHGALPAAIHAQLLRHARLPIERLRLQPLGDLARHLAERRMLQSLGGHLRAQGLLPARAQCIERLRLLAFAVPRDQDFRQQFLKLGRGLLTGVRAATARCSRVSNATAG